MNLIQIFFAKCGGADILTLEKCPSDVSKAVSVGITIIFTGIFAALSGGYAFYKVFHNENQAIAMGLLWGFMIFNLDRYIVMSIRKRNSKSKEFLTATPRIILAIIISLVVAKPLEVRLFQDRIMGTISDNKLSKLEQNAIKINDITGKETKDIKYAENENEVNDLEKKLQGECQTQECKTAFASMGRARTRYLARRAELDRMIDEAQRNINFINNTERYKETYILDDIERTELTQEGREKLARYTGLIPGYRSQKTAARTEYDDKVKRYNDLDKQYKNGIKTDLASKKDVGRTLASEKLLADSIAIALGEESNAAASLAYKDNFITQVEALGQLTQWQDDKKDEVGNVIKRADNTMYWMNIAIILLFIVIECAPIFVKLITSRGQYDVAQEADDTMRESIVIHEANTEIAVAEQKSQLQLQALMDNQQAQMGLVQMAIQTWQAQKRIQLNNGQLTDKAYQEMIQEILNFDILSNSGLKDKKKKRSLGMGRLFKLGANFFNSSNSNSKASSNVNTP